MARAGGAAAAAFEERLHELGIHDDDPDIDAHELGRRGAMLAAADIVWKRHLGPLLNTQQVMELLGVGTRQAVSDRVKRGRILALPTEGRELEYPAFQFDEHGRPYPEVARVLRLFADAHITGHTLASWFRTPQTLLDGMTPAAWMAAGRDPELLATAAFRTASRLAH